MIRPEPQPEADALRTAARRYAGLAAALAEVGLRIGRLTGQLARDWPDGHGQAWAERADRLRREVEREALAAAELAELLGWRAAAAERDQPHAGGPTGVDPAVGGVAGVHRGMRLGGVEGRRAEDARGMRIAELPPGAASPG